MTETTPNRSPLFQNQRSDVGTKNESEHPSPEPWDILIVDDDESVLAVTKIALRKFQVDDRSIRIHTAKSREEAQSYLSNHGIVAVMITDVVMESDDAGLKLVSWVREQEVYDAMRLVIRTGQAGLAPEESVLDDLDINDYWPKTDVSAHRMRTILTGLIRSFRDIKVIEKQKVRLEEIQAALFESERYKALGALASGVTHDVNNALTPITAYASMLVEIEDLTPAERKEYAEIILQASQDAALVVKRLKGNYGSDQLLSSAMGISLQQLLMDTAALARPKVAAQEESLGIELPLVVDIEHDLHLKCNAGEVRQALLNLIINAVDAMTRHGTIKVYSELNTEHVDLVVEDTGEGMSPSVLNRCKRAFFTTKGEKGTGLGLAMVERTMRDHGGTVLIESELGKGTSVRLRIPLSQA